MVVLCFCSPLISWGDDTIWQAYFANGLVQPATSLPLHCSGCLVGIQKTWPFIIAKIGWHATSCINFKLGDRCSLSLGDVPCYLRISCLLSQWLTGLNFWGLHMLVGKMASLNLYFMVLRLSKVVMFKDMFFFLIPWFSWSQVINE